MSAHGPTGSPVSWNICVGHAPRHAGLFRGIQDFRRALDGRILSFDPAGRPPPASDGDHTGVVRVACGGTALHRHCHLLPRQAARQADEAVAGADMLIAHSMFRAHCSWTRSNAARHGCGYWAVPHGCLDPRGMRRRAVWKRLWMWREGCAFLAAADRVVFATRRERDKALPWLRHAGAVGAGGRTMAADTVIPWPVSLPDLTDRDAARARVRQRLGLREDERILLWVGRLHSTKRPLETISAFVAAAPPDCHLVLVGMDEDLTATGIAARIPAGFRGRIHVVGELTGRALEEMRLAADGYISLSMKENFGYSAAEALACGLPVILSPGHDLAADLPMRGDRLACGWLLPDDSIAAARRAITEFSDMTRGGDAPASPARDMGMNGRRWAADQLAFDRFQDRLVELAGATATRLPGHRRP